MATNERLKPLKNQLRVASDWGCAGVSVVGLNYYKDDTRRLLADIYCKQSYGGPFICFMQGHGGKYREGTPPYGDLLAAYIRENSLGEITETPGVRNSSHPEEGYHNKGFFWAVNFDALRIWFLDNVDPNYQHEQAKLDSVNYYSTQVNK